MTIAKWVGEWLPVIWSLLAIIIVFGLWYSGAFDKLIQRITKFGGFGLSFEFSETSALQTKESVQDSLGKVRTSLERKIGADASALSLQETFRQVVEATSLKTTKQYRATIHIQDPLFQNQLYQLVDYYPRGGGAGRTFSVRAGIIGLAWRTQGFQEWNQLSDVGADKLVALWGMTFQEASDRQVIDTRKLFMAFPLRAPETNTPIAVFYADFEGREVLGLEPVDKPETLDEGRRKALEAENKQKLEALATELESSFNDHLARQLTKFVEDLRKGSPLIDLEKLT